MRVLCLTLCVPPDDPSTASTALSLAEMAPPHRTAPYLAFARAKDRADAAGRGSAFELAAT